MGRILALAWECTIGEAAGFGPQQCGNILSEAEIMVVNEERDEKNLGAAAKQSRPDAVKENDLLEQLNCELRDLICSRMVLDAHQRLQPYGLTLEQMRSVMSRSGAD